jgi:hypothetical protein
MPPPFNNWLPAIKFDAEPLFIHGSLPACECSRALIRAIRHPIPHSRFSSGLRAGG